jgi:selenide, water dikinase
VLGWLTMGIWNEAGVFAVRAGPPLLENMKNYLSNQPLRKHIPQRDFLGLISTGDKYAVASKGWWFALEGRYLWTVSLFTATCNAC